MKKREKIKFSLKKNDMVEVIAGSSKGNRGKIIAIHRQTGRVTIENSNMAIKTKKVTPQQDQHFVKKEMPLDYSNVLIVCPVCDRGVRHKIVLSDNALEKTKTRACKRCHGELPSSVDKGKKYG